MSKSKKYFLIGFIIFFIIIILILLDISKKTKWPNNHNAIKKVEKPSNFTTFYK